MSYSVLQQPVLFQPAYNDMMFVVTSSNNGQTNFNYIADVYIGSDVIRLTAPAHPTYGSGVFNVGRIVESYVGSDCIINESPSGFIQNENSYKSYYVKFGESYGTSGTIYANINTTPTKYVWNGVLDFVANQSFQYGTYVLDESSNTLNTTIEQNVEATHNAWQYIIANDVTALKYAVVKSYDTNNALLKTVAVENSFQTSGTIGHHFMRFTCGKPQLNNLVPPFAYGSQPIIPSTATKYTVKFADTSGGTGSYDSSTYTYNIVDADCNYQTYRLHFLNELGAFESYNFTKLSRKSNEINRSEYKGISGALTSASAFGYSKSDRLRKTSFTSTSEMIKLKSDWLSDAESLWLQQLITSPEIYIDDATNGLIAVTCKASKMDTKTRLNDKLFNLELDIELSYNRYRQRD